MEKDTRPKATDFRIGNIISYKGNFEIIDSLHSDNTFRIKRGDSSEGCFKTYGIEPISLTDEWLTKVGFKIAEGGFVKRYSRFGDAEKSFLATEYNCKMKRWVFIVGCDNTETVLIINSFEYVHQLQNLYFSLTGEELTLKAS